MKRYYLMACAILLFSSFVPIDNVHAAPSADVETPESWEQIAPGIEYQLYHLNSPRVINIFVTRMDRSNPNVTIESSIGQGKLAYGNETVRDMANRYDQAINYWGEWGNRNDVAVAINGYFFGGAYEPPGVPWSGQIHSGWYAKRYSEYVGDAGFAWMMDGDARIGSCVYHNAKQLITFIDAGYAPKFQGINVIRSDENIILYTPQYDVDTNTSGSVLELLVELTQPAALVAAPNMVTGYIRAIYESGGSTQIPFDHVVISAWGDVRSAMLSRIASGAIAIGDEVGISQEISNCPISEHQFDWTNTYAGIGGDYHFLNDGVVQTDFNNNDATYPNSRTAIAYSSNYIFFIVVDRWDSGVSEGMTIPELGYFARDTLGATDAVSQDSGGSSTMVINGEVVNNTYCNYNGCPRPWNEGPNPTITDSESQSIPRDIYIESGRRNGMAMLNGLDVEEPWVANGMMMVAVEPLYKSATFTPGAIVPAEVLADIHLGPGDNYDHIASVPQGAYVEILPHLNSLNGVLAKGFYWWKVNYAGTEGWVREQDLQDGQAVSLTAEFTSTVTAGVAPLSVDFTNTSIGYFNDSLWDFGDGGSSDQEHPSYVFNTPGVYTVTLTVAGPSAGDTEVKPAFITVYEPVKADFSARPVIGTPPLEVNFTNTSTGDYSDWTWIFHDSSTSTEVSPSREYTTTGVYTVTLLVSGPGGTDTLVVPNAVSVYDQIFNAYLPVMHRTPFVPLASQPVIPNRPFPTLHRYPPTTISYRDE
ncbi:MAG: PKD domain-containing protein [Anaerolineales bacterium]|jgi:PKD repeat protein